MRTVEIDRVPVRLGQFVQLAGLADSGADAKRLIAAGAVAVNTAVETRRGRQLHRGDVVTVAGEDVTVG